MKYAMKWIALGRVHCGGTIRKAGLWGLLAAAFWIGSGMPVQGDVIAGWKKINSSTGLYPANQPGGSTGSTGYPVSATTNHPKISAEIPKPTNFYRYNDNSWCYIEPFSTVTVVNAVSMTNQFAYRGAKAYAITNYLEFKFSLSNGYKVSFTNFITKMQNDERALVLHFRSSTDNYTYDLITQSTDHVTMKMTNRNYVATTNFFRIYTNTLSLLNVTHSTFNVRMYGAQAKSAWTYLYFTNCNNEVSSPAKNLMFTFQGRVQRIGDFRPPSGPLAGGNTVFLTNTLVPIGNGTDITNIVLDGKTAELTAPPNQGTNWAKFTVPPGDSPGYKDVLIYASSTNSEWIGDYRYNPTGQIFRASPTSGIVGATVAIIGQDLCDGTDITNMTFGGATVVPSSQSSTQLVVTAPAGNGTVGVRLWSTSYGYSEKTSVFTYEGSVSTPELKILGANGAVVASGEAASVGKGTDFRVVRGWPTTNTLAITNDGTGLLTISGVTTNGAGAERFRVTGIPASLAAGVAAPITVVFDAAVAGTHTAAVQIVNDSATTPYVLNLSGTAEPGRIGVVATSGVSTVGTVSAAAGAAQPGPIKLEYTYYHQQNVYSAAQLATAGLTNVQITALGFGVAQALNPHIQSNYVVRLKETARTSWTGGDKDMEATDLAQVFSNATVPFVVGNAAHLALDTIFQLRTHTALLVDCGYARRTSGILDGRINYQNVADSVVFLQRDSADALSVFTDAANLVTNLLPVMTVAWQQMSDVGVAPAMCPSTGGVVVTISGTNLCNGTLGDVASVTLCGGAATVQSVAGSTQIVVLANSGGTIGRGAVEIVSAQMGRTAVANLFTYNAAGAIDSVAPAIGTNGMAVTIWGTNLSAGIVGDVASVTLAGITAAVQSVAGSTQIVATAGAGSPGLSGDVVVTSTSFGLITKTNAFAYAAPQMQVLGTNLATVASGDAAARAVGTDYGIWKAGVVTTNTFAITNIGLVDVEITGVSTNE